MKKLKVKRITAFLMALTMTVSTVLTAFAADGWTPAKAMQTEDQKGYIEFTFGSDIEQFCNYRLIMDDFNQIM